MNILAVCPCCSRSMLHHISDRKDYWFCRHCWSEMPNLAEVKQSVSPRLIDLSVRLE